MAALEHLLNGVNMDLPDRFLHHAWIASQSFALVASSPEAFLFRNDLAFFQAVALELRRARVEDAGDESNGTELETALRQVVSDAVTATGVIDVYSAAGISRPDLSIINDDFSRRLVTSPHPNVQIEVLRRLLASALRSIAKQNGVAERKFSEMLERAMRAYTNRSLTAAEVIAELVSMAKQMKEDYARGARLGLRDDELAFYDAVSQNDSAVVELGAEVLKQIAHELVAVVRTNATVDWDKKEQVRASLRRHVRRLLVKYHYPPDKQEAAIHLVMQQAERLARETVDQ